tara:strand:- start:1039 stop:1461 length:423 start_codon:yes stop_codon:yes gene_type:complete
MEISEELKYKVLKQLNSDELFLRFENPTGNLACMEMSSMGAMHLSNYFGSIMIMHFKEHTLVYDHLNTWDFHCNLVLSNYKYPEPLKDIKKEKIFYDLPYSKKITFYYSNDRLKKERKSKPFIKVLSQLYNLEDLTSDTT